MSGKLVSEQSLSSDSKLADLLAGFKEESTVGKTVDSLNKLLEQARIKFRLTIQR
jgi:hypothetical protein